MSLVSSLNHVVGQQRAVAILKTALDAYWHDRTKTPKPFPHVLITGPGGLGKTFLSELCATQLHGELGTKFQAHRGVGTKHLHC